MKFADILASLIHDMKNSLGMLLNSLGELLDDPLADAQPAVSPGQSPGQLGVVHLAVELGGSAAVHELVLGHRVPHGLHEGVEEDGLEFLGGLPQCRR